MSKTNKTICIVLSFVCAAFLGSVLYGEKLSHENTKKELQEIVLQDIEQTEVFLKQNPASMESWVDYLGIEQAKNAINHPSAESNNDLFSLMIALKYANGVKKYPVFVNLHESLGALLDWRKSNFLQTAFRNRQILSNLASSRSYLVGTEAGMALINAAQELKQDQKMTLEMDFQDQMKGDLPCELPPPPFSAAVPKAGALSKQDVSPSAKGQKGPEKAPKSRRSMLYNKLQKTHSGADESEDSEDSEETTTEPGTQKSKVSLKSKPFILANTPSLTELMIREDKKGQTPSKVQPGAVRQLAVFENQVPEGRAVAFFGGIPIPVIRPFQENVPLPRPILGENMRPEIEAPELENTPNLPEDSREFAPGSVSEMENFQGFLSESIPEAESENGKQEKSESTPPRSVPQRKDVSRSETLKPFTNRIPALPSLHYSLKETIGNAPTAPKLEGNQTIDELQKNLVGDFSKDLESVRKCWLLEEFKAPADADLAAAYQNIRIAFSHFYTTLVRMNEKKRQGWIQRLHLEELNLNGTPQLDVLQDVYRQLSNGNIGLELSVFVNFRESIKQYLTFVSMKNDPDQAGEMFAQARNRVVKLLEIVEKDHSSIIERALEDELNWLETAGQAEKSIRATRQMWTKPNLIGQASASLFERFGTHKIQEKENISDQVQRTSIQGTSFFDGSLIMKPVSNPNRIELAVILDGFSNSQTHAYAGPAVISSQAKSRIQAEKKIFFDQVGFSTNNAKVNIRTNSQIQNVQDVWNRELVKNFVYRRANVRKEETESTLTAQNTARLRARFNKQVEDVIRNWNTQMTKLVHGHLGMRDLEFLNTHTWTDDAGAHGQTLFSCREGMGAYSAPPQVPEATDLHFAVHETALQNVFAGFLGGLNLDVYARKHLKETAPDFLAKALQNAESKSASESKEDEKSRDDDWAMRFPKDWPISISMQDGKLLVVIHNSGMEVNKKSYPAVDIIVAYTIEAQEDGIHFVRDGEIEILPPDYDPDSNKRLPASMVSLRRVMGKRLQEAFTPEFVLKEQALVKNPEKDSQFANIYIKPVFVQAKDGWLQVGMNLFEKK